MTLKDTATVRAYHNDRIGRFGVEASEALGWKGQDSQQQRFQDVAGLADFCGHTVLDVGCGHGDLYDFLKGQGDIQYTGIDNIEAFLEVAVNRFGGHRDAKFLLGDFNTVELPRTDYIICCGALNYRNSDSKYLFKTISKLFDAASLGLGLNLLSKVDFLDGILNVADFDEVLAFCRQLSPQVHVVARPDEDNFTLLLCRDGI
jgi:SAM-dependent methyltransferase